MTIRIIRNLAYALIGLSLLGLVLWYLSTHPAPTSPVSEVATTTPSSPLPPARITENAQYYTIDASYPAETPLKASAGAEADTHAVALMKAFELMTIGEFKQNADFANLSPEDIELLRLDERKYSLSVDYKTYAGPRTISYVYTIFQDTGGAHPNTFFRTFTFDMNTGEFLSLTSLFIDGSGPLEKLSVIARAELPKQIGEYADAEFIESGTNPEEATFQTFYIEGTTLFLLFPPYQVGPYVLGAITLPVPLSRLAEILKPPYR